MNSTINELITGDYQVEGDAIIYADTDSSYFTVSPMLEKSPELREALSTKEAIIEFYDEIANMANATFPEFMHKTFNTGIERGSIIRAGRELIGISGLFITKKRYAILMYDKEGKRLDVDGKPGKIKAMGLDLKRSDTPKLMQNFLEEILMDLLSGGSEADVQSSIKVFRRSFRDLPAWQKGTPKKVNAVIEYTNKAMKSADPSAYKSKSKARGSNMIPGHVQASINWNRLRKINQDFYSMEIQDGQKVIVCKLKPNNNYAMNSIAYPIDQMHLPDWFKKLPFDNEQMESTIIDKKIGNLLGVLEWNLSISKGSKAFDDLFVYEV